VCQGRTTWQSSGLVLTPRKGGSRREHGPMRPAKSVPPDRTGRWHAVMVWAMLLFPCVGSGWVCGKGMGDCRREA